MRWTLLACLLVLAGCGEKPEPAVATTASTGILFQYDVGNHLHRYGGRVFNDGRYELYSGDPKWERFDPFTATQMEALRAAVDQAVTANLPSEIKHGTPGPDAAKATFNLDGHKVVVDNYPKDSPKQIEHVLDRIQELRKRPPTPTVWKLWSEGKVVRLEARCDIADVKVLQRLRDAIFIKDSEADRPSAKDPPDGTPLVSILFKNPKGEERLEVFGDGRRVDHTVDGKETHHLGADQLNAVRAALAGTDWAKLPPRLC